MRTELNEQLSFVSIPELYDNISMKINGKTADKYDCTKVLVGDAIYNAIQRYYTNGGKDKTDFAMRWLCFGPKATLNNYEVEVEDGWCVMD